MSFDVVGDHVGRRIYDVMRANPDLGGPDKEITMAALHDGRRPRSRQARTERTWVEAACPIHRPATDFNEGVEEPGGRLA